MCPIQYIDPCEAQLRDTLQMVPDSVTLRTAFLLLTRTTWLTPDNYGRYARQLAGLVYSTDPAKSKLLVDLTHNADPSLAQIAIPAIYVGIGQFQFSEAVIDDETSRSRDNSRQSRTTRGACSVTWLHYATHADEAGMMAEVTACAAGGLGPLLKKFMHLDNYRVVGISTPVQRKQQDGQSYFQVDVTATFHFNNTIVVAEESLRLKKIVATIVSDTEPPDIIST